MKKTIINILILVVLLSCGETTIKKQESNPPESAQKVPESDVLPSADYSSLLQNYECDMDMAEVARAMGVPESSLGIPDHAKKPGFDAQGRCIFSITGFGDEVGGEGSIISWSSYIGMTLTEIQREIEGYQERQREMPENLQKMTGMSIELAETGDTYLAYQKKHGRMLILNANYGGIVLTYGALNAATTRTPEQQEALIGKMTQLANYLLKKHRK